ncbi:MAG: immunoglobulin domain-containing protein [Verrucomicrobiota bacterium]
MKINKLIVLASCLSGVLAHAQITPGFEPGNLSVLRIGNGTASLATSGDPVFLDEYTTNGILTNSIAIPTNGATSLIIGSASSEGAISRSANSNFIVMVGYNTNLLYGSGLPSSASTNVPRGIATIDFNGNYAFITNTTNAFTKNNIRSGVSDGSNNFWAVGAVSGLVYMGLASPPATVQSTLANSEVVNIFNGNLCFSSQKSTPGVYSVAGLPVTTNSSAALLFGTGSGSSIYGFAISPENTIAYVADDRAPSSGGGIQKYTNNGAWGLAYTLAAGSTNGARGLAVAFGQPPVIYATTTETSANRLIAITDTNSSAVVTVLATAAANEVFRGVQFSPQGSPPSISGPLQSQTVDQGQDALLAVTATGTGTLYYLWESNSTPLTDWETNASFTLATTNEPPESFPVEVLISNAWGTALSSATLTINSSNVPPPAPVITAEPAGLAVNAGDTAVFSVAATGMSLSYQWQLNNTNLTDSAFIIGSTTPTLTLSNVFGDSAGSYTVTITNAGGATNSTPAILTVADPWLTAQPTGRTYLAGDTISLSVGAIGTQLTYQWTLNGADISGASNSLFLSSNAVAGQSGSYAVVISGTYGAVTSATAMVIVAPAQTTFFPSNLVVLRVGDGAQTLINSGNTLFLDQFAFNGAYVSTMALPDSGASSLLISGVATSEGYMTLSGDGRLLAVAGYSTNRGVLTSSLSSSASSAVPRVIGTIDGAGNYTLAASTSVQYSAANLRAGATDGSDNFWGAGSAGGTYYFGNAAAAGTVQNSVANCRVINVVNGSLVFSTQSGTAGLYSLGGLPTTTAVTNLLFATGSSSSPEDFAINAATNLAYVADDSSNGGIQCWQFSGGTWTKAYVLGSGAAGIGARSLTVDFSGAYPVIYAVTAETAANRLIAITDTGAGSAALTLASCPPNELFRAVKFAPALNPFPAPALSAATLSGGQFSFNVTGVAGYEYVIEASADLANWLPCQTNLAPFTFTLTNAADYSQQFYRAVYIP